MNKGFDFENSLVSFFRSQGYLAKRGIPLVVENSQDATDVDVYGMKFTYPFIETNLVCDCKNKAKPKPFERLFWTKGMAEYVKVDNVYVALPKVQTKVAKFASTIGVNILTKDKIQMFECGIYSYGICDEVLDKDKERDIAMLYRKVKQLYILKNPYMLFNGCIGNINLVVKLKREKNNTVTRKLDIIIVELVILLTVALLRMCNKLISLDEKGIIDEITTKLTYGDIAEDKAKNIISSVSRLAIEVIKNETGVIKYGIEDFNFIKPPEYTQDIIGLINRIIMNPRHYIDLPQITDYILYDVVVCGNKYNKDNFKEIFGEKFIDEKIKGLKNVLHFTNYYLKTEFNIDEIFI